MKHFIDKKISRSSSHGSSSTFPSVESSVSGVRRRAGTSSGERNFPGDIGSKSRRNFRGEVLGILVALKIFRGDLCRRRGAVLTCLESRGGVEGGVAERDGVMEMA